MKKIIPVGLLAGTVLLQGCNPKSEKQDLVIDETSIACKSILFGVAERCTTQAIVLGKDLKGTSNYSIAGKSGVENDTGNMLSSNVPNNITEISDSIRLEAKKQQEKRVFSTDVEANITGITLRGNAKGYSSIIGNMEGKTYKPGYGINDSLDSQKNIILNNVNAQSRCNDTISGVGKSITTNVVNNVNCEGIVKNFTQEEQDLLFIIGSRLLESKEELRGKNISPAIIAFTYIKSLESGKIENNITDPYFQEKLIKAIEIVRSKHYVDIDGVKVDISLEIKENKVSTLGKSLLGGIFGLGIIGFFANKRKKNK